MKYEPPLRPGTTKEVACSLGLSSELGISYSLGEVFSKTPSEKFLLWYRWKPYGVIPKSLKSKLLREVIII